MSTSNFPLYFRIYISYFVEFAVFHSNQGSETECYSEIEVAGKVHFESRKSTGRFVFLALPLQPCFATNTPDRVALVPMLKGNVI